MGPFRVIIVPSILTFNISSPDHVVGRQYIHHVFKRRRYLRITIPLFAFEQDQMSIDAIGSVLRCCYSQWYLFQLRQQLYKNRRKSVNQSVCHVVKISIPSYSETSIFIPSCPCLSVSIPSYPYLSLAVHFYLDLSLAITSFSQVSPAITSYYQLSLSIAIPGIPQLSLAISSNSSKPAISSRLPLSPCMSSYIYLSISLNLRLQM